VQKDRARLRDIFLRTSIVTRKQKKLLLRIIAAAIVTVLLFFIPVSGIPRLLLYMIPYLTVGYDILRRAALGIIHGQLFDENFLMALATIGAIIIAATDSGDYTEAVAVMLFYQIGELFQSCAVGKSRRNVAALMSIRPDTVNMESEGRISVVSPEDVDIGSITVVYPGEKIAIDGIITEGRSSLDTSPITGESVPREVKEGDSVTSGCVNLSGVLKIRTDRQFGESTVVKILALMEDAGKKKSRPEKFISRFSKIYTPAVCVAALLLALLPPVFTLTVSGRADFSEWIYRALTFLVISCPCALVISVPLTFFSGIGGAGKKGILIKGSGCLEALSRSDTVVFDKTGTLTHGVFEVTDIHSEALSKSRLLSIAASLESHSSHPIAKSIMKAAENVESTEVCDLKEIAGEGIVGCVNGRPAAIGNIALMKTLGVSLPDNIPEPIGARVHIASDDNYLGYIDLSDRIKESSAEGIAELKNAGIKKAFMLTGDNRITAKRIADRLGIDEVRYELLPSDKVTEIEKLLKESKGNLVFVGDGINDAPALSRADVGIAMGGIGSDAAIEAADAVIMDDDPGKVALAVRLSKKCMSIVYQNIVFSVSVKLICLLLGAAGITDLWPAIFADVGVMVIAVLNSMRALW